MIRIWLVAAEEPACVLVGLGERRETLEGAAGDHAAASASPACPAAAGARRPRDVVVERDVEQVHAALAPQHAVDLPDVALDRPRVELVLSLAPDLMQDHAHVPVAQAVPRGTGSGW
jgi:hypothetical protein